MVKNVNDAYANYVDTGVINLHTLIDESSLLHPTASNANAIAIQDLQKRMNESGLKEI